MTNKKIRHDVYIMKKVNRTELRTRITSGLRHRT